MSFNPFSSMPLTGALDPQFGEGWTQFLAVHAELANIIYLAENIDAVRAAAANISRGLIVVEGVAPAALGGIVYIDIPDPLTVDDILDYSVILEGSNATLYAEPTGFFTTRIEAPGVLKLTLAVGAPAVLQSGTVRWTISYLN